MNETTRTNCPFGQFVLEKTGIHDANFLNDVASIVGGKGIFPTSRPAFLTRPYHANSPSESN